MIYPLVFGYNYTVLYSLFDLFKKESEKVLLPLHQEKPLLQQIQCLQNQALYPVGILTTDKVPLVLHEF